MYMNTICTCCNREIKEGARPIKYHNKYFDSGECVQVFKKLNAMYGEWMPFQLQDL
jgi:hypothetical protein